MNQKPQENIQIQLKDYKKEMKHLHLKYLTLITIFIFSFILLSQSSENVSDESKPKRIKNPNTMTIKIAVTSLINEDDTLKNEYMIVNENQQRIFEKVKLIKIENINEEQKLVTIEVNKVQGNKFKVSSQTKYFLLEFIPSGKIISKKGASNEISF